MFLLLFLLVYLAPSNSPPLFPFRSQIVIIQDSIESEKEGVRLHELSEDGTKGLLPLDTSPVFRCRFRRETKRQTHEIMKKV